MNEAWFFSVGKKAGRDGDGAESRFSVPAICRLSHWGLRSARLAILHGIGTFEVLATKSNFECCAFHTKLLGGPDWELW